MNITRFEVRGLFGKQDVDIPIANNRLVIVGVNGTGKSTVLNLFYYFIARRWTKIVEMQFDSFRLELDGASLALTKEEILNWQSSRAAISRLVRNIAPHGPNALTDEVINELFVQPTWDEADYVRLSVILNLPRSNIRRLRSLIDD